MSDYLLIYVIGSIIAAILVLRRRLYLTSEITIIDIFVSVISSIGSWIIVLAFIIHILTTNFSDIVVYRKKD